MVCLVQFVQLYRKTLRRASWQISVISEIPYFASAFIKARIVIRIQSPTDFYCFLSVTVAPLHYLLNFRVFTLIIIEKTTAPETYITASYIETLRLSLHRNTCLDFVLTANDIVILECRAVTLPRRETRWNLQGCPKLPDRSRPLVGQVHHIVGTCGGHIAA